jgi:hypothetical protein
MADIGITDKRQDVIWELSKCGWEFDDKTGLLRYEMDDNENSEQGGGI